MFGKTSVLDFFRKPADPKDLVRKWQADLRSEQRGLERQIRDLAREEKNAQKQVRDAAKAGDIAGAKALAREIVRTRAAATRLHTNKAHLIDMNARLTEQLGLVKVAGTLQKSGEVMAAVNRLVKVPQLMGTMRAMGREMARAGFIGEVMEDGLDSAAGVEGEDEAADEAVAAVLAEVAGEDVAAMAGAGAVPRAKLPGAAVAAGEEGEAEDADALELKARLEAVRS